MERLILILILFGASFQSQAGIDACTNLSNQSEANRCAVMALNSYDKKISNIYNDYLKKLNSSERESLKDSQRLWVQFKEKDCKFESSPVSKGSMYQYVFSACLIDRTEKRMTELEKMSNCNNGTEPSCL